jgi:hypothetical protein
MGNLVFQATLGGQVNLVGPNTASTYNINVPSVNGNLVTTGDTGTVTNTMLAGSITNAKLTNSSVTVGSTAISLGSAATTVAGLTLTSPVISTISNTGTLTLPTSTDTLVGRATTDTLTNKTLTTPTIGSGGANFNGSTSGTINLVATATAGSNTATLPAATGTVMVSGNMPAFSAYGSASLSMASSTWTKLATNNKEFDTASAFDNVTNYRFQPTVAGYYFLEACLGIGGTSGTNYAGAIYKNGSQYKSGTQYANNPSGGTVVQVTCITYLNGSTDYVEAYAQQNSGTTQGTGTGSFQYRFEGFLARTA